MTGVRRRASWARAISRQTFCCAASGAYNALILRLSVGTGAMATALKHLTTDEFLLWAEGREGRWELFDGVPVMMSPERVLHGDTKGEAYAALREALRRAGLPCRAYPDGVAVQISARTTYQPDALVSCGPRPPAGALAIAEPVVVVEVLSPSTASIDHGLKLSGYFCCRASSTTSFSIPTGGWSSTTSVGPATRSRRACFPKARRSSTRPASRWPSRRCSRRFPIRTGRAAFRARPIVE